MKLAHQPQPLILNSKKEIITKIIQEKPKPRIHNYASENLHQIKVDSFNHELAPTAHKLEVSPSAFSYGTFENNFSSSGHPRVMRNSHSALLVESINHSNRNGTPTLKHTHSLVSTPNKPSAKKTKNPLINKAIKDA
jgi:hypothetical protein